MHQAYRFDTPASPDLAQVGGKALSLIRMTQKGLQVPAGFVLTVSFFKPWLDQITATSEWKAALQADPADLRHHTEGLEALARAMTLDNEQGQSLETELTSLRSAGAPLVMAVRSSSPEEDLEDLSFAGGYETVLGVTEDTLQNAIGRCFASCLDERVFAYKREHGLPLDRPRIAVIVQIQIAADSAGVAFSLNPLNNAYDQAVINANFGLGETVVSGAVSPDSFVVDKLSGEILEKNLGGKESATWAIPGGGTQQKPVAPGAGYCLTDRQVRSLTDLLIRVEDYYGKPIDIEWAFADDHLFLLQARPITAYFPLHPSLLTAPGEPKQLYADATMAKWGMSQPLSVMGSDYMSHANYAMLTMVMGDVGMEGVQAIRPTVPGRVYGNLSVSMKTTGRQRAIDSFKIMDALASDTLASMEGLDDYIPDKLPPSLKGLALKAVRQNIGLILASLRALKDPETFRSRYIQEEVAIRGALERIANDTRIKSARELTTCLMEVMLQTDYIDVALSTIFASQMATSRIKKIFKNDDPEVQELLPYLDRALPDNITVEMGLAMFKLARLPEFRNGASAEEIQMRLANRELSPKFLAAWDSFIERFGFRGPMEMDPATVRHYEEPAELLRQLIDLAKNTGGEHDPIKIHNRARDKRESAYGRLLEVARKKGRRQERKLVKNYKILTKLGGFRESPKYIFVVLTDLVRRRLLAEARHLVATGQLDQVEQVFDLTLDDLAQGMANPDLDLRVQAEENTRYLNKLRRVRNLPHIVDSRGRIFRAPPRPAGPGEIAGMPISPGVVRGPAVVLERPDDKPVRPGDILVARATDPGWTPLFVNASGVILEVGGMLQHGALVAREYGKPCIAGIENATTILRDGQMLEMDGANGIVRYI